MWLIVSMNYFIWWFINIFIAVNVISSHAITIMLAAYPIIISIHHVFAIIISDQSYAITVANISIWLF